MLDMTCHTNNKGLKQQYYLETAPWVHKDGSHGVIVASPPPQFEEN